MTKAVLDSHSIQEAADLSGLPASTLRYYEDIGLLGPVERNASSGHRRYSDEDVDLAIAVACLSAAGMSIEEMRSYLANCEDGDGGVQSQIELLERQQQRLTQQARELHLRQRYIDHKLAYWRARQAGDQPALAEARLQVRAIAAQLHTQRTADRVESEQHP